MLSESENVCKFTTKFVENMWANVLLTDKNHLLKSMENFFYILYRLKET